MPLDIERQMRFWRSEETDRPLLTYHVGPYYPVKRYPNVTASLPSGHLTPKDLSIPALLKDFDLLRDQYAQVEDDMVYVASQLYGFPMIEAILGCKVSVSRTSGSFWTEPFLDDWSMLDSLPDRINKGWLDKLVEMMEATVRWAAGAYPVPLPNLQMVAEMMGGARGATQLALDFFDYPAESKRLAEICLKIWMDVHEIVEPMCPRYEGGYAAHDYGLWAPEQVDVTQEDYSALLSPPIFHDFILPCQRAILKVLPYNILHLHPPSIYVLDQVLDLPELKAINLNYEVGRRDLSTMIPVWKRIQEHKPLLIYASHINEEEIARIVMELDPRGLALHPVVADAEQARKMTAAVEKAAAQRAKQKH